MKANTITLILLFSINFCIAQINIVPNPSFEEYDTCPNYLSQISRSIGWYSSMGTPDYFNACSTDTFSSGQHIVNVPLNWTGYRTPATGNAYSGIIARWQGTNASKESIGINLINPLQIGVTYYASFKVSLAGQTNPFAWCGINKLGIFFSTIQYNDSNPISTCSNCAQICSDSIVIDTLNWTRITGYFTADSNYSYINIGRFNFNSLTDSFQIIGTGCNAYYYIDDVCISDDSLFAFGYPITKVEEKLIEKKIFLSPNPIEDIVFITCVGVTVKKFMIYDTDYKLRMEINGEFEKASMINLGALSPGIYFIVGIVNNEIIIESKRIVKL